jgi:hypothetical protein
LDERVCAELPAKVRFWGGAAIAGEYPQYRLLISANTGAWLRLPATGIGSNGQAGIWQRGTPATGARQPARGAQL